MSVTTTFATADVGSIFLNGVSATEFDVNGIGAVFSTFASNYIGAPSPVPLILYSGYQAYSNAPNAPEYDGVTWGGLNYDVAVGAPTTTVSQTVTLSADVTGAGGGVIIGSYLQIQAQGLSAGATISATETFKDVTSGNTLATATYQQSNVGSNFLSLGGSSTNVAASVTITDQILAGTASANVGFSSVSLAYVEGDVSITKYVSVDGGNSWQTIANGGTTDGDSALDGCPVEYKVIVTNDSSNGVSFTGSVSDVGLAGVTGFTFGNNSTLTLASGGIATSDIITVASAGTVDTVDTATVTGTVSDSNGDSGTVSASSSADVTGLKASVSLDEQIQVNGGTWQDVGVGVLNNVTVLDNAALNYRVIVTNTGTTAITNLNLSDTFIQGSGLPLDFSIPAGTTLAPGTSATSELTGVSAFSGTNEDVSTVTANAVIQVGTAAGQSICDITASDTAEYTGVTYNGPNSDIVVDKQVWMCGTWTNVGPTVLANGSNDADFRVIVTNIGSLAVSNVTVTDTYVGGSGNFVFASTSLAVGGSITSNTLGVVAQVGTNITDTANATGTISSGGVTATVTASGTSDYSGVTGSIAIVKQISTDGTHWAAGTSDPTVAAGSTVYVRTIVTDNGGLNITGATVTDTYAGLATPSTFLFGPTGSTTTSTSIAINQSVTSDALTITAAANTNWDTASVTGTVSDNCGDTGPVSATSSADYTGTVTATGSISIDKEISVDCGKTWQDIGNGVLQNETASIGGMVEFRVVVTAVGGALSNITVADAGTGDITGFTFGGSATLASLAANASATSDIALTPALSGLEIDVATATGTVTGGSSLTVTAKDTAEYTGVKGNIIIDKQVSANGTTWYDVGSGVLQDPTVLTGGEVYYRVIVTDTGSSAITGIKVTDVGPGAPSGFTFGSNNASSVSLSANGSATSNVVGVTALVGYNMDTATVTGTITTGGNGCGGGGTTTVVGACDTGDYTGVNGSISLTKYVSVDGGKDWSVYSASNPPAALMGSNVEFEVVVKNTGTTALTGVSVGDVGGGSVTGFVFGVGNAATISLAAGASATSDVGSSTALCGVQTDTATATGTITLGSGTAIVSASSKADYQGINGEISLVKEVSVDGGQTWLDLNNCSNDPTITTGGTVDFRVVVTDIGNTAISGLKVTDAGTFASGHSISGFVLPTTTLAVGQSITSSIASTVALSGYQTDTADATGTVVLNGATASVSALSTADYTGTSNNGGGGCGGGGGGWGGGGCGGWGGGGGCGGGGNSGGGNSGGCGTGWGNGWYNGVSNGYGCGSSGSGNLCNEYGQAQSIEFCYSPSDCVSQQGLQSGLACVSGHDGCNTAFIEITNCANAYQSGAQCYYEGSVSSGQDIYASCGSGSFSGDLYVHCFSSQQSFNQHQSACQTDTYVGNGSQSVCLGDQVGCVTTVGYVGHNGSFCV